MLKIKKEIVSKDYTSCNFCDRGELSKSKMGLVYPYEEVVTVCRESGRGMKMAICQECLSELVDKTKKLGLK